jgi:hypothetical protein
MSSPTGPDNGLPVRMPRPRQPGRHRRPEPVVAPSNAPSLVLAVPGTPSGTVRSLAEETLSIARSELPGLRAQVGYVDGDDEEFPTLETVLAQEAAASSETVDAGDGGDSEGAAGADEEAGATGAAEAEAAATEPEADAAATDGASGDGAATERGKHAGAADPADASKKPEPPTPQPQFLDAPDVVVVPLLVGPDAAQTRRIRQAVLASGAVAELTDVLGPHPLLAEGVHVKLSEAGLARADRARLFTVATAADGIVLAAIGGEEAVQAAGITGMLLAARLAVPVLAAALDEEGGIARTAEQLRESGSQQVAVAPCLIGPEVPEGLLEAAAREADCSVSEPLGAYTAVGKLVASTYAAKLGIAQQQAPHGMPVR